MFLILLRNQVSNWMKDEGNLKIDEEDLAGEIIYLRTCWVILK